MVQGLGGLTPGAASGWYVGTEVPWTLRESLTGLLQLRWDDVGGDALWDPALGGTVAGRRLMGGVRVDLGSLVTLKSEVGWAIGDGARSFVPVRSWTFNVIAKRW